MSTVKRVVSKSASSSLRVQGGGEGRRTRSDGKDVSKTDEDP